MNEWEFCNHLADAADEHLRKQCRLDPLIDEVDEDMRGGVFFDVRIGRQHFEVKVREVTS